MAFDTSGRPCPARTGLFRKLRRLAVALCVPPAVLSLQAWNILDPMGSLLDWMIDGAVNSWKWVAGYILKKSDMDSSMWAAANSGLNKVAGVMAIVAVAAGAYGIVRAAATQDVGAVLGAVARTALAWPITVVCITLCVKGAALASSLTSSILQSWTSHDTEAPSISSDVLKGISVAPLVITICICVVFGSLVLILMMAARNFLLIFAIVIAAIPIMLQGWSTMRPLLSKWAGWIVGLILMQPVMALCIWVTCEMMATANTADDGSIMPTLIAIVGMILSSIFPFILIKQVADFIPGTLGLMRGASAGQAVVGTAAAAATAAVAGGLATGAKLAEAVADNKRNAGVAGGEAKPQGADPTSAAGDPDFKPSSSSSGAHGESATGQAVPAGLSTDCQETGSEQSAAEQDDASASAQEDDRKYSPSAAQALNAVAAGFDAAGMHHAAASAAALGSMAATGMPNVSMGSDPFHDGPASGGEGTDGMGQPDGPSSDGPVPTGTTPDGQPDIQAGSTGQSSDGSTAPETSAEGQSVPQEAMDAFAGQSGPTSSSHSASAQSGMSAAASSTVSGQGAVPASVASELGVATDTAIPSAQSTQDSPQTMASGTSVQTESPMGVSTSAAGQQTNNVPAAASAAFGPAPVEGSAPSSTQAGAVVPSERNSVPAPASVRAESHPGGTAGVAGQQAGEVPVAAATAFGTANVVSAAAAQASSASAASQVMSGISVAPASTGKAPDQPTASAVTVGRPSGDNVPEQTSTNVPATIPVGTSSAPAGGMASTVPASAASAVAPADSVNAAATPAMDVRQSMQQPAQPSRMNDTAESPTSAVRQTTGNVAMTQAPATAAARPGSHSAAPSDMPPESAAAQTFPVSQPMQPQAMPTQQPVAEPARRQPVGQSSSTVSTTQQPTAQPVQNGQAMPQSQPVPTQHAANAPTQQTADSVQPSAIRQSNQSAQAAPDQQPQSGDVPGSKKPFVLKASDVRDPQAKPGDVKADIGSGLSIKITRRNTRGGR